MASFSGRIAVLLSMCLLFGSRGSFGYTGDALCDHIDNKYQCGTDPCGCTDSELNCKVCNTGSGCSQCNNGYWRSDYDKLCVPCSDIDDCSHCTDTTGCQQCNSGCQPVFNKCSIKYCDCTGGPSPVPDPTTPAPISLAEEIDALRGEYDNFWVGNNTSTLEAMRQFFSIDSEICWGGFDCADLDTFFDNFAGLCDGGSISTFSDIVFQDNRVIYSFYRACLNNFHGLFWINGVGITMYDEYADITQQIVNFRDLDELLPILQAFAQA